ncbi:Amidase [Dictyocaulus viviparus]|uniref:fatty acid amide hydrolase n=1 Tax=Dictyocaulus viviparus TaxID=29172 RepID=A0A0D8XXL9_DICVI|nr:Amidase [Dictyocaulus viviparus]
MVVHLRSLITERQEERERSILFANHSANKIESVKREKIASWNFQELKENLQKGTVSCLDVLRTYQWKALRAHEKTNCITLFIKEAESWAIDWDIKASSPDFVKPPFFGVPISLKESIPLEGYDTTRGFAQDIGKPVKSDALLIQHIKMLGFIPYVQTNVPQSLLSYSCGNPVYGTTSSPIDQSRTSGGSTGGEAALIAAGGSVIGIGGDVGGSIRIPCHFTGIVGIKPSHFRFSHCGISGSIPGRPLVNANDGPMSMDVQTSVDFLKEVWSDNWISKNDPYVPPVPWNDELFRSDRKYRIGYYVDDGWFTPVPAIQRAVLEAKEHLESYGHTVVSFHPPHIPQMMKHYVRTLCVDGGAFIFNKLVNDIIDRSLYGQMLIFRAPIWLQRLLAYPINFLEPRIANMMRSLTLSTRELRESYAEIENYRSEFVKLMMDDNIDALLCPPQVLTSPAHDIPAKLFSAISYTAIFNLLDFAAGTIQIHFIFINHHHIAV